MGKNHFFAVANTKESRKDEKYRCFLKNRDDDYYLGVSITPECNVLKTVEKVILIRRVLKSKGLKMFVSRATPNALQLQTLC